jgi:addiction module HigA family antidote
MNTLANIHPGEILFEEFLQPLNITQSQIAEAIHLSVQDINDIIQGQKNITADTAIRFSIYFGTSDKFWLGLQNDYDLEQARESVDFAQIRKVA